MPRRPRLEVENGLHHVTGRAPKGLVLFRDAADHRLYLDLLAAEVTERRWSLRTYCLMPNHVHLLVKTPEMDLGDGIKAVHERLARRVHQKYDGHGHVFGDRFFNGLVRTEEHEVACFRYIARNPVKARLCSTAEEWPWSAHRYLTGDSAAPAFLDVDAALSVVSPAGYRDLVSMEDVSLLDALANLHPETWMARAVDDHELSVAFLAQRTGWSQSTVYRRLAQARAAR